MAHGTATNSIELSGDAKSFDRVARKWNVDYAFYKTGPDKYLLFFKAGQADAMTACFSEYSRKMLSKAKSNRVPIREQLQQAADQLSKEKPKQKERAKEVEGIAITYDDLYIEESDDFLEKFREIILDFKRLIKKFGSTLMMLLLLTTIRNSIRSFFTIMLKGYHIFILKEIKLTSYYT